MKSGLGDKRDIVVFGALLILAGFIITAFILYVAFRRGFISADPLFYIPVSCAIGVLGYFIALTKSFLLIALTFPFTFILAFFPLMLKGSDSSSFDNLGFPVVMMSLNCLALYAACQPKGSVNGTMTNSWSYWISRLIFIIFAFAYDHLKYWLIRAL